MRCALREHCRWAVLIAASLVTTSGFADDSQPDATPPAETPIGRFLGQLFEQIGQGDGVPAGQAEPKPPSQPEKSNAARIVPDAIDDRAVASRGQQRDLERAKQLLHAGDSDTGLAILQRLLDSDEDTLVLNDDGQWESLQRATEDVIGHTNGDLRQLYVERFSPQADELLAAAKRTGDPQRFADAARRFLHTPSGQEAARILARLFRDSGEPVEAAYWLRRTSDGDGLQLSHREEVDLVDDAPVSDWRQPFGGPKNHGAFSNVDPVLIERWATPVVVRPTVREQVEDLLRDLADNHRAAVPAALPLVVNRRIVTRTLRGLSVLDADSGELLWESAEGVSVERLLTGDGVSRPGGERSSGNNRPISLYGGTNADGHPLSGLLFRDGVYGHVSSDGEQVFVLEDHASLSYRQPGYFWGQSVEDDPFGRDWSSNQLVAYDLESGSVRWRVGGESLGESFDPPLAGTQFLGAPVVDGDELFVIGERNGKSVYLFVLDRRTGEPLWSHSLSEVGAAIHQDLVRRWWPAQPAVGNGVIVCPTTNGWMIAIDRLQRRIRWSYRYIETRQRKVNSSRSRVASAGPLNSRWCPSAPIMTQRHVLFTPSELPDALYGDQPRLVCLDLLTGERVWWEEKDESLYLGGVAGENVLIVGEEAIEARNITTGKRAWETPLNLKSARVRQNNVPPSRTLLGDAGPPSGRGIIAGDLYLLPLRSGQLWTVSLATGEVVRAVALRDHEEPLGNLLLYRGRLLSAGPLGVRCFEERSAIAAEIATKSSPQELTASRLRAAELKYVEGDFGGARKLLQTLRETQLSAPQQQHVAELLWESLLQLVSIDLSAADDELAELTELAVSDEQQLAVERIRADRLVARGDVVAAFDVFWRHAQRPRDLMVTEGRTSVQFRRWLAGHLQSLWESAGADERQSFDTRIAAAADVAMSASQLERRWWAGVLRFHEAGSELRRAMAEQAVAEEQWTTAENILLQLVEESHSADLQLWALEQLVRLMLDRDRDSDAAMYLDRYAAQLVRGDELRQNLSSRIPTEAGISVPTWSDGPWKLTRSPASASREMFVPVLAVESDLPSVDQLMLHVDANLDRLSIRQPGGGHEWETPLQAQAQTFQNQTTGIASIGQLLLVVYRGVLHAISAVDHETMWRRPFDVEGTAGGHVRGPTMVRQNELRTANSFLWVAGVRQTKTPMGMLAEWKPGYVASFGRNSITLTDPLTGQTLWTRQGIAPRTMVYGAGELLFVVPPAPETAYALRVVDGLPHDLPGLNEALLSAVSITERGIVQIEEQQAFPLFGWGKPTVELRLVDLLAGIEVWSMAFPAETQFATLSREQIVAVDPDGAVSLIDCRLGESRLLGSVGEEITQESQRIFAVSEPGRLYLAFNKPPRPGSYSRGYQSMPMHGTLAAFDTRGGMLWSESIEDQNLIVDQLSHLPVLLMASQRSEREANVTSQKITVEVLDKQTGKHLLEESRYVTGSSVRVLEVDPARQMIDLNTSRERLRLQIDPK